MNKVVRTSSIIQYEGIFRHPFQLLNPSSFHSSPILERRRYSNPDSGYSNYKKRARRMNRKEQLFRDVGGFAEEFFKKLKYQDEDYRSPWFTELGSDRNRGGRSRNTGPKPGRGRRFDFCDDDGVEAEQMFRAAFGGNKYFDWSFTNEGPEREYTSRYNTRSDFDWSFTNDEPEREYTSRFNTRSERNWRHEFDDEYDSSEESNCSAVDLTSQRQALGLKASGPLCLEDVKNAYRTCALKWHPDRHQGSSKVVAEEKFKVCSAAYQSLCDEMVS